MRLRILYIIYGKHADLEIHTETETESSANLVPQKRRSNQFGRKLVS